MLVVVGAILGAVVSKIADFISSATVGVPNGVPTDWQPLFNLGFKVLFFVVTGLVVTVVFLAVFEKIGMLKLEES
jgi:hypothetical protein